MLNVCTRLLVTRLQNLLHFCNIQSLNFFARFAIFLFSRFIQLDGVIFASCDSAHLLQGVPFQTEGFQEPTEQ